MGVASVTVFAFFAALGGCADVLGLVSERHLGDAGADPYALDVGSTITDAGPDTSGPWGCLAVPSVPPDPDAQVTVNIVTYDPAFTFKSAGAIDGGSDLDLTTYKAVPGVPVRACPNIDDAGCASDASAFQITDDAGRTSLMVRADFAGFFDLAPPGMIPETVYGPLVAGESTVAFNAPLQTLDGAELLSSVIGVPQLIGSDAGVGQAFFGALDCLDHHAPGVSFTVSNPGPKTVMFYLSSGLPSTSATSTESSLGGGGAVNLPEGPMTISATLLEGQVQIGSANIVVRAGSTVFVYFRARSH